MPLGPQLRRKACICLLSPFPLNDFWLHQDSGVPQDFIFIFHFHVSHLWQDSRYDCTHMLWSCWGFLQARLSPPHGRWHGPHIGGPFCDKPPGIFWMSCQCACILASYVLYHCYATPLKHSKMHEICTLKHHQTWLNSTMGKSNTGCSWQEKLNPFTTNRYFDSGLVAVFSIVESGSCSSGKVLSSADFSGHQLIKTIKQNSVLWESNACSIHFFCLFIYYWHSLIVFWFINQLHSPKKDGKSCKSWQQQLQED